ncbi:MAG: hypothetical protein ACO3LD_10705 [Luminiphilus sp.]
MSYGIWRKRGKDWASFELDGCDSWRWRKIPETKRRKIQSKALKLGVLWPESHDPSFVVWFVGQRDKWRTVREVNTRGDHRLWISHENESALAAALNALGYASINGDRLTQG